MNIGLYFGSFNPIHFGHLIIANEVLNETSLEKIWMIVSPQNPLKNNTALLNEYDRLQLVRLAIDGDNRIKAVDIEFKLPKPSFSINTLVYLKEKYPQHNFSIIMGSDSFQNIENWKNYSEIISNYPIVVYKRPGFKILKTFNASISVLDTPLLEISASKIRTAIKNGKSIRYLVPENVLEEIISRRFYRKKLKNTTKK